ncbi:MAG: MFS transporter [Candidatus Nanopelagicales bacterium]
MLTPYVDLLRRPGTLRFSSAGFVQRLPMSMLGLGVVLFLTLRGESYGLAGAVSATGALATAVIGPFLSRAIDRYTQHRVLPWAVAFSVAMQTTFLVLVLVGAPVWTWFVSIALGEGFVPNVGSIIRARWAHVLTAAGDVRTAFALESVIDEVVFVAGPPVATLLAVSWESWGAIVASILLLVVGTVLLVPQRATEPPAAGPEHHEGRAAIRYAGVPLVFAVFILVGGVFGSSEVSTVAFAQENDARAWTGLLLALYALGSGISGLVLGTLHPRLALNRQWLVALVALAVVGLPFPFIRSVVVMGAFSLFAGLAVAPTLITGMALVERLVPAQRLTEGLTVAMAGLTVGFAAGTTVAGLLIDAHGSPAGYAVLSVCAVLGALLGTAGVRSLGRALRTADRERAEQDAATGPETGPGTGGVAPA